MDKRTEREREREVGRGGEGRWRSTIEKGKKVEREGTEGVKGGKENTEKKRRENRRKGGNTCCKKRLLRARVMRRSRM